MQDQIFINVTIFIKNVVAVAAYSRLASRSQVKFQAMKLSPLSALFASLVFGCESDTHCTSGLPRHFRSKKRSHLMADYLACQSVAGVGVFPRHIWHKTSFIPTCVKSRSLPVNKARWRNHVTDLRWVQYSWSHGSASRDGSSSQCDGPIPPRPIRFTARQGSAAQVPDSAKDDGSSRRVTSQSAGGHDLAANDEPEIVDNPAGVADPAHDDDDPAGVCWPSTCCWRPSTCSRIGSSTSCQAFGWRVVQVRESHDNPRSPWLPACLWWDGPAKTGQNTTDQEMGIAGKGWRASSRLPQ